MKVHPIWDNFALGEVSPRLWHREGVANRSLSKLDNMIVTSQGSAKRRGGFRTTSFVNINPDPAPLTNPTAINPTARFGRITWLEVSDSLGFILQWLEKIETGPDEGQYSKEQYVAISTKFGKHIAQADNLMPNANFQLVQNGNATGWSSSTTSTVAVGKLSLYAMSRNIHVAQSFNQFLSYSNVFAANDSFTTVIDIDLPDGDVDFTINLGTGINGAPDGLRDIARWDLRTAGRHKRAVVHTSSITQVWYSIQIEDNAVSDTGVLNPRVDIRGVQLWDTNNEPEQEMISIANHLSTMPNAQFGQVPAEPTMFMFSHRTKPTEVIYDVTLGAFTVRNITFTSRPSAWPTYEDCTVMGFFQQRLWVANLPSDTETFWASKSGVYRNFALGTGTADDAMELDMAKTGGIKWILGLRNILFGTNNSEHIATSQDGVIFTGDIQMDLQTANGSRLVQAEEIGNNAIYVNGDGTKIRSSFWRWEENSWKSKDITYLAEHLFEGQNIRRLAYQKHPEKILWILSESGKLYACTFDDSLEMVGFHEHPTGHQLIDICIGDNEGESILFATFMIGRFVVTARLDENLNSDLSYYTDNPDTIDDLPWLAGETIVAKTDGVKNDYITVDSSGAVLGLDSFDPDTVEIGLPYTARLKTLPMDFATQAGSSPSWKKRWNQIYARLVSGAPYPTINGQLPTESEYTTDADPSIEDVRATNIGNDAHAVIDIVQADPYDLEVSGIFGEMVQNRL